MVPPKCYGGNGIITGYATGGVPAYTYLWSSSSPFTIVERPTTLAIFTDKFHLQGSFSLANLGTTAEIVCDSGELSAQSGYCALLVAPLSGSSTLLSIGCPNCIDFSVVCLQTL